MRLDAFVDKVKAEGQKYQRVLPWRYIDDPYAVLVSEVMLQQTQVSRVLGKWERFLMLFPTLDALAAADQATVLEQWQGLGYNRRALALKRCAEICSQDYGGVLPKDHDELLALPGIGPATAAGVRSFAYNLPSVYLETNVRCVFLHELFPHEEGVSDKQLIPYIEQTCPTDDPRSWYYALLDYGAHLKATSGNASRRSAHYTKQSTFEGSRRQKRAFLVREVLAEPGIDLEHLVLKLATFEQQHGRDALMQSEVEGILDDLVNEGFFAREGNTFMA